jgi:hypothetical protein
MKTNSLFKKLKLVASDKKFLVLLAFSSILSVQTAKADTSCYLYGSPYCSGGTTVSGNVYISADGENDILIDGRDVAGSSYNWNTNGRNGSHTLQECQYTTENQTTCTQVYVPNEVYVSNRVYVSNYVYVDDWECDQYNDDGDCVDYVDNGYYEDDGYYVDQGGYVDEGGYQNQCTTTPVDVTDCGSVLYVNVVSPVQPTPVPVQPTPAPNSPVALVTSILPTSRSVKVNTPATAFMTVLAVSNDGSVGQNCSIAMATGIPAQFSYQATNPANNAPVGSPNQPFTVTPGVGSTFIFTVTPTAVFNPTQLAFNVSCSNATAAAVYTDINTLLISSSATPPVDMIAISATATGDGVVHLNDGSGAFAISTANVGSAGAINATGLLKTSSSLVSIGICPTDSSAQCLPGTFAGGAGSATTPAVSEAANATGTFSIFVTAPSASQILTWKSSGDSAQRAQYTAACAYYRSITSLDALNNRVNVVFKDGGGVVRGGTSVALQAALPAACN